MSPPRDLVIDRNHFFRHFSGDIVYTPGWTAVGSGISDTLVLVTRTYTRPYRRTSRTRSGRGPACVATYWYLLRPEMCTDRHKSPHSHGVSNLHILHRTLLSLFLSSFCHSSSPHSAIPPSSPLFHSTRVSSFSYDSLLEFSPFPAHVTQLPSYFAWKTRLRDK